MKLLFVADLFDLPVRHGSTVISFNWMRELRRRHEVKLLSLKPPNAVARMELAQMGIELVSPRRRLAGTIGQLRWPASRRPRAILRISWPVVRSAVDELARRGDADALISVGPSTAGLFGGRLPMPSIFVPYDSVTLNFHDRRDHVPAGWRRLYERVEKHKWGHVERRLFGKADACVLVTERDEEAVSRMLPVRERARVRVIPNGVDIEYFHPGDEVPVPRTIVFTGVLGASHSVIALDWFLREIYPVVRARVPTLSMEIVGKGALAELHRAASRLPGVTVVGEVPDLRPHAWRAAVYVSPLLAGSGIKNRMLEALAMGKAIVATPTSCYGLSEGARREAIRVVEPGAFATALIDLLGDAPAQAALAMAARREAVECHSWGSVARRVEGLLQEITQ